MDENLKSTREGFGEALLEIGRENSNVVVLTADLGESMRVEAFAKEFPDRFFQFGVAEQNMMGVAAGLALAGKIPFVTSFAVFSPTRAMDQLRVSVCYPKLNVKVIGGHAGIITGEDGASHQALEDIAMMRVLPNMTVLVPCDFNEAKALTKASLEINGPTYIRLTRPKSEIITPENSGVRIGKASILREGKGVTVIACGPILSNVIKACEEMDAEIINCHTVKPIDVEAIVGSAKKTGRVVTIEDHQVNGGLGGAVAEVLSQNCPVPLKIIGVNDTFTESGKPEELLEKYGLGVDNIRKIMREFFDKVTPS